MGDGETVVAEASTVMDYTSNAYPALNATVAHSDGSFTSEANGEFTTSADAAFVGSNSTQEHHTDTTNEIKAAGENVATFESAPTDTSNAVGYNYNLNGNTDAGAGDAMSVENGNVADNVTGANTTPEFLGGTVSATSGEEDRLWNIVRANSSDFNAWTGLIEETEKVAEDNITKIRKVYDAFLAEFPLCYGYWKKYADHEARVGAMDKVVEVYERAVQGVTYSVDIWLHYCIFAINTYGDPETIRRLFERGLAYVGADYLSFSLWDKYIEYEYMHQEWGRLAVIYTRILENPIQNFDRYLSSFKDLAETRPLSELKTPEEVTDLGALSVSSAKENEGEGHSDTAEQSPKPLNTGSTETEESQIYISTREEIYKKSKEFESKIIGFESAIRRPYFHVRPLNVTELENWHNYLDFIEREGDFNKVVRLYERCVIACANYTEYWVRYVLCMEASGSMDLAENNLARATQVFVKRQPEIHLFAARFKEQNGDIPGARAAYQLVHSEISPGLLEAIIKHANMERRLGNLEEAFSLYEQSIAIEKGKEHSQALPMLYAQYSRFLYVVSGDAKKARKILVEALDHVQPLKPLLEALIHFETIQPPPRQIEYLDELVDKFLNPNSDSQGIASIAEKEELSSIYLEFLGLFRDAQSIKKAEDRHAKLFQPHRSTSEFKKRLAEDYLASDKAKMARSLNSAAPSPAQSTMGAYPNAQNQWAGAYGVQPQTWPPVTQAPVQQWTPGYGQQSAYGGATYSGYPGAYTAPQPPAALPQTAAYGAYPSTYPVQQTYPQQTYAQPAAVPPPLTPSQQPAAVPQAYYGSYY